MTFKAPADGPPGRFLLRLAERLASPAACERVFIPLLADLQFEHGRATAPGGRLRVRLKWTIAFAQAMGLELASASVAYLRENGWGVTEGERQATRRLLASIAGAAVVASVVILLDVPARGLFRHLDLRLPSALCLALPAASLFGVVLAAHGQPLAAPRWRPILSVASLVGLVTFAVAAWITPRANQTFRERVFASLIAGHGPATEMPRRGDRELSFVELGARASELRTLGEERAAGGADLEWHKKPALGASCLALALAAAAITRRTRRSVWRWPAGILIVVAWGGLLRAGEQAADAGAVAPAFAMWGPCVAAALLGLAALGGGPDYRISSTPGKK